MDKLWRINPEKGCTNTSADVFFPVAPGGKHSKLYQAQVADAKRICRGCPVIAECLAFALAHEDSGIWAGTTEEERDELRSVAA